MHLWKQLLDEVEAQGSSVQRLHAPSHIGVRGNENADLLPDTGRSSLLLRGYATTSRAILDMLDSESQAEEESDLEACLLSACGRRPKESEAKVPPCLLCRHGKRRHGNPSCARHSWRTMGHHNQKN